MSAHEGLPPHAARTHDGARVHCIERILDSYGALTHDRLYELAGAAAWAGGPSFDATLHAAVASGRVRALGGVLFASAHHPPGAPGPAAKAPAGPVGAGVGGERHAARSSDSPRVSVMPRGRAAPRSGS